MGLVDVWTRVFGISNAAPFPSPSHGAAYKWGNLDLLRVAYLRALNEGVSSSTSVPGRYYLCLAVRSGQPATFDISSIWDFCHKWKGFRLGDGRFLVDSEDFAHDVAAFLERAVGVDGVNQRRHHVLTVSTDLFE